MITARSQARRILSIVPFGMLAFIGAACHPRLPSDTTTTDVVRDAQTLYDFGPERPPLNAEDPYFKGPVVENDGIPRMWISTATLKSEVAMPKTRILARIRSEQAYAPMGIAAGYNYVWRNSRDTSLARHWVTRIVPADSAMPRHVLRRDDRLREYTHGDPKEPRLVILHVHSVALAACLEDALCRPSGHCGYY